MNIYITKNRGILFGLFAILPTLILPFFSESYEVRKNQVNTAIAHCMADYTDHPFGSEAYKTGCAKCIGLGMAMMDANSHLGVDPIDYRMTIESKECQGLKVAPITTQLPKSWLVRIPKILLVLSIIIFFIPSFKNIKKDHQSQDNCNHKP